MTLLSASLMLISCTGIPDGVSAVEGFDLERYLGTWYEIARLDHPFERGLTHVKAEYRHLGSGVIEVVNGGYDAVGRRWKEVRGRAVFVGDPGVGRLKVSFFGPFYGAYNVIALDRERYSWAMVCGPSREYLWVLARTPDLDPEILIRLVQQAAALDFEIARLIRVIHGTAPPPAG